MRNRYKKVCPFCKSECENFEGSNLFCNCSSKYYWVDQVWLNRNTGEEVWESEDVKSVYKHYTDTGAVYITSEPKESEDTE